MGSSSIAHQPSTPSWPGWPAAIGSCLRSPGRRPRRPRRPRRRSRARARAAYRSNGRRPTTEGRQSRRTTRVIGCRARVDGPMAHRTSRPHDAAHGLAGGGDVRRSGPGDERDRGFGLVAQLGGGDVRTAHGRDPDGGPVGDGGNGPPALGLGLRPNSRRPVDRRRAAASRTRPCCRPRGRPRRPN